MSASLAAPAPAGLTPDRLRGRPGGAIAPFQAVRPRLFGIAYRVLGEAPEADDVVQDAWIRWQGTDQSGVRDAAAFLATTTTRLAINVTRSARVRRERSTDLHRIDLIDTEADPSSRAEHDEALTLAVLVLLEKLSPTERAVYVLREAFDYPHREIARILSLSEVNARQVLTRARRRLNGGHRRPVTTSERRRFLAALAGAARAGELRTLERLLAADAASV